MEQSGQTSPGLPVSGLFCKREIEFPLVSSVINLAFCYKQPKLYPMKQNSKGKRVISLEAKIQHSKITLIYSDSNTALGSKRDSFTYLLTHSCNKYL